jgi:outer membrane protein
MRQRPIARILLQGLIMLFGIKMAAQQPVTLHQLLQTAETNYPLLKAKGLDVKAAQKGVEISRSTLIPTMDASYQVNYATYNNITGMAYPQYLMPISGPPSSSNNMSGVFGSEAGLLLNWQPLTFGQRQSQVNYSKVGAQYATADQQNEIFLHKIKVANAYFDLLAANEVSKVYEDNVKRTEVVLSEVRTLVQNGIRPGVDTSLFKAEVSRAKVELLNVNKYRDQTAIALSQLLASDNKVTVADTNYFSKLPVLSTGADSAQNPVISLFTSSIELSRARRKIISHTMAPTLGVWGTTYARGSGIQYNGEVNTTEGLGFQRFNYGVGAQISIPVLQFARVRPQLQQEDFLIKSNEEKLNEISLQIRKQVEAADTALITTLAIAKESPLFYESAAFSYKALESRYRSGLANFSDLIQAQYTLLKAETDYKLSYMNVWKALLYKVSVKGDLNLLLNQVN